MTMSSSPERELLSQSAARQLLERAGQIDLESTSVDTLRAAALEAGISEAAFEAALLEMRGKLANQPALRTPNWNRRFGWAVGIGAALLVLGTFLIPRTVGVGGANALES